MQRFCQFLVVQDKQQAACKLLASQHLKTRVCTTALQIKKLIFAKV